MLEAHEVSHEYSDMRKRWLAIIWIVTPASG